MYSTIFWRRSVPIIIVAHALHWHHLAYSSVPKSNGQSGVYGPMRVRIPKARSYFHYWGYITLG